MRNRDVTVALALKMMAPNDATLKKGKGVWICLLLEIPIIDDVVDE